jgi:glycine cleavage system aminomethyltransferase T
MATWRAHGFPLFSHLTSEPAARSRVRTGICAAASPLATRFAVHTTARTAESYLTAQVVTAQAMVMEVWGPTAPNVVSAVASPDVPLLILVSL